MAEPPPLPSKKLLTPASEKSGTDIKSKTFEGTASGFKTGGLERKRLQAAQSSARTWINSQKGIEIVSIESCTGELLAFVTVWYR